MCRRLLFGRPMRCWKKSISSRRGKKPLSRSRIMRRNPEQGRSPVGRRRKRRTRIRRIRIKRTRIRTTLMTRKTCRTRKILTVRIPTRLMMKTNRVITRRMTIHPMRKIRRSRILRIPMRGKIRIPRHPSRGRRSRMRRNRAKKMP